MNARRRRADGWRTTAWLTLAFAVARALHASDLPLDQIEFFESKIRPIFAEHCYKCHSVESGKSKADLLLDTRDALRKGGGSGPAIVPGNPEKSLLIEAIRYRNEDLQMPPPEEGGKLSNDQIAALEHWIRLGAPDPRTGGRPHPMDMSAARQHWAFQPVVKPAVPRTKNPQWIATPVDAFVLAQLEAKNLSPTPPADPRTLLRRVTYDLTGLPPTPEEMDAFVADASVDAYDRVVERLLASPRYGERWGRFWLDVARYADTKGYLAGNVERRFTFSHTYRDYVIRAFNDDKPYDQFILEQIAADHLAVGEDKSSLAALGYLTLGRRFLNNQNDIIDDRIDVVTRGMMGLTVTCARCHDHKFDPIPTTDYYSLHGVFASSEEPAEKPLLGAIRDTPEYQEFLRKQAELESTIKERETEEVKKFLTTVRAQSGDYLLAVRDLARAPSGENVEVFAGVRKINAEVLKRWQAFLAEGSLREHPVFAPWFELAGLSENEFAKKAEETITRWKALHTADTVDVARFNPIVLAAFTREANPPRSLADVVVIYNRIFAAADATKAIPSAGKTAGANKAKGTAKLADAAPAPSPALGNPDQETIRELIHGDKAPTNLAHATVAELLKRQINNRVAELRREIDALSWTERGAPLRAMALVDKPSPKNSFVFGRGNPANRGAEAPRQFLEILAGDRRVPFTQGSGRLELAREIARPDNPLTARVFVNRVWGWHFGAGLVRTPSDFGVRTAAPVQSALLDWLAAAFVENGWSVKQLHRWIVRASTYRQSSDAQANATIVDPENQLIHHFPRRRLEFEALRDTLLAVAGTLDLRPGGIPDNLATQPFTTRRTVYGFIDRQNLPGMFRTFDYPNPDVSAAERFATTVPQQALFMLNSPFVQEQARQLVRRASLVKDLSPSQKIDRLYRFLFQRAPDNDELSLARAFVDKPSLSISASDVASSGWQYGRGTFDETTQRVCDFTVMSEQKEGRLTPGTKFPDPVFGRLSLTASGGIPGRTPEFAAVRRWVAPGDGVVHIVGSLGHASDSGDGVRGRIVSSAAGQLGEWSVHNEKMATTIEAVSVKAGDSLDFVVDCNITSTADIFTWAPTLTLKPVGDLPSRVWSAKSDFDHPPTPFAPLTRWEEFAQVLLSSNELAFVD